VVCQQVVPVEAGTADGRSVIETSMRAMPVVLMEPARQLDSAGLGVVIRATVSPFPQSGLNEAFCFAVGTGGVGTGETQANAELVAEATEVAGAIAGTIVAEHTGDGDAEAGIVIDGRLQESGGRRSFLVRKDLREGNAGVVVDGDMHVLPAGAMDAAATVAGDATTYGLETSDLFDVEVKQIAGGSMLVAQDGSGRFQIANATEVESAQDAADGGTTQPGGQSDAQSGPALAAQSLDQVHALGRATTRRTQRTGRPILQAGTSLLLITPNPLASGFGGDLELGCSRVQGHRLRKNFIRQLLSQNRSESGILVDVHSMSPKCWIASTQSASPVFIEWTTC